MNIPPLAEDVVLDKVAKIRQAGESTPGYGELVLKRGFRCREKGGYRPVLLTTARSDARGTSPSPPSEPH